MSVNTQNPANDRPAPSPQESLQARFRSFYENLVEEGVIVEPNQPIRDFSSYENERPIEVQGKPLSQEIIETRR